MFAIERTANIKDDPPQTQELTYTWRSENCRRSYCSKGLCFFKFSGLARSPLLFSGLTRKLKKSPSAISHRGVGHSLWAGGCDSSKAGGEFISYW